MKFKQLSIFAALLLSLSACNQIQDSQRLIDLPPQVLPTQRRAHLLVDFSAFRCLNCPKAAAEAQQLSAIYDSTLVVVTMHPPVSPLTQGTVDYTCAAADTYFAFLGGEATTPLPAGNIDFVREPTPALIEYPLLETTLAARQTEPLLVTPVLHTDYDETSRILSVSADIVQHNPSNPTDCALTLWLVEDSVEGLQLMPDNTVNEHYWHRHLLRDKLTPSQPYTLPESYRAPYCHVVALLQDPTTRQVLNVAQKPIPVTHNPSPVTEELVLFVDGYDEVEEELTITLTESEVDPLTGRFKIEVSGLILSGTNAFDVTITRSETGLVDEFCCGTMCTAGNGELTETKSFRITQTTDWYLHYFPEPVSDVTYQLVFSNSTQTRTLHIHFMHDNQ